MVAYDVRLSKRARADLELVLRSPYKSKVRELLELIKNNPYASPPPYEKLIGDLFGAYSRRISLQHRLVYAVDEELRQVRVLRMWTHYEK